jgi:hypothetical protein
MIIKPTNLVRIILPLALGSLLASGCAQYMAIKQPSPFTPTCLTTGTKRIDIVAQLGQPVTSEQQTNMLTDNYKYVDGGSKNNGGSKTVRVILYTGGDLFTLWLDQILTIPVEKFGFAGTDHSVTVAYTKSTDGLWHAETIDNKELPGRSHKKEEY